MNLEIEHKFLVANTSFKNIAYKSAKIKQGYLSSDLNRTVRIRVKETQAYITIKGKSSEDGTTRLEWEKEIDINEANELLKLCENFFIEKTRYYVKQDEFIFEIDEFEGKNKGLIIAEIELTNVNAKFSHPSWLGEDVTGDIRYYNSYLSKKPYNLW